MGVKVQILIEAQYSENRNWEDPSKPISWKGKGSTWYKVEVDSDDLLYADAETVLAEMVALESDSMYKYEYLQHYEIFGRIETFSSDAFSTIDRRLKEKSF